MWHSGKLKKIKICIICLLFCESLKSISLENWNTDNVETIMAMFMNCKTLTSLNLSNFNTTKITTFAYLFWNCENLSSLNVSGWDISLETTNNSFNTMFYRNGKLMNVDFTSWCVEHINDDPTNLNLYNLQALQMVRIQHFQKNQIGENLVNLLRKIQITNDHLR